MFWRKVKPGDPVIYTLWKHSSSPGPRAASIRAAQNGDDYYYQVDKFWLVQQILDNGRLMLRTRRGKIHVIDPADRNLRTPRFWERLLWRSRFPKLEAGQEDAA